MPLASTPYEGDAFRSVNDRRADSGFFAVGPEARTKRHGLGNVARAEAETLRVVTSTSDATELSDNPSPGTGAVGEITRVSGIELKGALENCPPTVVSGRRTVNQ